MEDVQSLVLHVDNYALSAFIGYLVLIVIVGVLAARFSSQGISNFFIGGRKMSMLVVALSAVVSGRSAWLLLGFTGMAYTMGLSALWAAAGYIIAEFFLFFFYAPRIRRFSENFDCITIPDFFEERFADKTGTIRTVVAVIIIIFMLAYVSAQFVAGGKTFSASFQLTQNQGLLLTAVIILFYTVMGGFLAVSVTDTIQGFIMIIALVVLPIITIIHLGGFSAFYEQASLIPTEGGRFTGAFSLSAGALIGFLGIGLGSVGNPHIIARYMSIKNPAKLKMTAMVGTGANILMALGALATGMAGRIYFPDLNFLPGADPENLYPTLAGEHLHPIMFGVVIASIFAAIMSTADSQLLVAASALVRDIYEKMIYRHKEISQRKLVYISRWFVVFLVIAALLLGFVAEQLVFWLVLFAWAGLGAAFGPTSILALYWKNVTKAGIISGIITGAATVIIWVRVDFLKDMIYELVPAFTLALLVTWVVSLFTQKADNNEEIFNQIIHTNQK
ncbi:MAG: sodium/proline symporter [Bacteroidales bacterium]